MLITMDLWILQPMGWYICSVANIVEKDIPTQGRRQAGCVNFVYCTYQWNTYTHPGGGAAAKPPPPWVGIFVCSIFTLEKIYPPSPSSTLSGYIFSLIFATEKIYQPIGCKVHKSIVICIRQTCLGERRYILFCADQTMWGQRHILICLVRG